MTHHDFGNTINNSKYFSAEKDFIKNLHNLQKEQDKKDKRKKEYSFLKDLNKDILENKLINSKEDSYTEWYNLTPDRLWPLIKNSLKDPNTKWSLKDESSLKDEYCLTYNFRYMRDIVNSITKDAPKEKKMEQIEQIKKKCDEWLDHETDKVVRYRIKEFTKKLSDVNRTMGPYT